MTNGVGYTLASLTKAGTRYVTATDTSLSLSATSGPITVTAASATGVVFSQPPTDTPAGATFLVTAQVVDQYSNLVSSYTSNVTVAIASGPSGGTLLGTTTVQASGGVATFSNLCIDQAGTYTLTPSARAWAAPPPPTRSPSRRGRPRNWRSRLSPATRWVRRRSRRPCRWPSRTSTATR